MLQKPSTKETADEIMALVEYEHNKIKKNLLAATLSIKNDKGLMEKVLS